LEIDAMEHWWNRIPCAKIHLVVLRDTQYPILQFLYVFLQGFTEGCPPQKWIFVLILHIKK